MKTQQNIKTSRFTLIELLVVIAIIGVLASILMPALSAARGRALVSSCQSNMKELGLAAHRYADDFGGVVVPRRNFDGDYWGPRLVAYSYINYKSLLCPVSKEEILSTTAKVPNENYRKIWRIGDFTKKRNTWSVGQACSYGINRTYIYDYNDAPAKNTILTEALIKKPSFFLTFAETRTRSANSGPLDSYPSYMVRSKLTNDKAGFLYPWHNDSICNVLFYDGHVKAFNAGVGQDVGAEVLYNDGYVGNHDPSTDGKKVSHWYYKN